ncbi:MAG: hypothetical protein M3436_20740, partial [Pseudomonadota bacterium]|nr:hypothetical protein [Pseudomonadota bacterium]
MSAWRAEDARPPTWSITSIPRVRVRQWVLSFPIPLRCRFAAHPQLLGPVLQSSTRVISTFLIQQAGLKRTEADTGAVTLTTALWIGRQFEHPSA